MPLHVSLGDVRLATLWGEPAPLACLPARASLVVSRFAWIRREGAELIAETSRGPGLVVLEDARAVALLHALGKPRQVDAELARRLGLPLEAAQQVTSLLLQGRVVVDVESRPSEDDLPLAVWEFHDLLFQARSRSGRRHGPIGATYRFRDRFPIAPALPVAREGPAVSLYRPDWERVQQADPPLARVQSLRISTRHYGTELLTVDQLGEMLYRVVRVDDVWDVPAAPQSNGLAERFVAKPYPSGGSLYELELYPVVQACAGLSPGLYHYAGDRHVLEPVAPLHDEGLGLVADAAAGMGIDPSSIQVVMVLTARMGRIAWKYQSLALSLVLKHVGVVLQTMYLSAAAMSIGACAVGSGDSDRFARASGIDIYAEPAVGEMVLGSLPEGHG